MAQMSLGAMPHIRIMHAIELLGNIVAPEVRNHTQSKAIEKAGIGEN
jgi:hypothetical protein